MPISTNTLRLCWAAGSFALGAAGWLASGQAATHELTVVNAEKNSLKDENERLRGELAEAHHDVDTLRADERTGRDAMQACRESALRSEATAAMVPALQAHATQCEAEVAGWRAEGGLARIVSELEKEEASLNTDLAFGIISYGNGPVAESSRQKEDRERLDIIDKRIALLITSQACPAPPR